MQKFLGLDVGTTRIGVAFADTNIKIAYPISTIEAGDAAAASIASLLRMKGATAIVVGLPRNASGQETAQSEYTRQFAEQLTSLGIPVHFQDESLTSILAEERLKERGKPYEKSDIDAEAATIILQDYINQL